MYIALIYDFDGTLAPSNMQEYAFIPALGRSAEEFWHQSNAISEQHDADPILSYMALMVTEAKRVGLPLRREDFKKYGHNITFFEGVREWFGRINKYAAERGITMLHYINSSGIKEIIEGTDIAHEFKNIYACEFLYDDEGAAYWAAVAVNYTNKTQFIFKISKGVESVADTKQVNRYMKDEKRPVPFSRMIYIGDGTTDIPCMRTVKVQGGHSIAVFDPKDENKRAMENLIAENRVSHVCPADYRENSPMDILVKSIIDKIVDPRG